MCELQLQVKLKTIDVQVCLCPCSHLRHREVESRPQDFRLLICLWEGLVTSSTPVDFFTRLEAGCIHVQSAFRPEVASDARSPEVDIQGLQGVGFVSDPAPVARVNVQHQR